MNNTLAVAAALSALTLLTACGNVTAEQRAAGDPTLPSTALPSTALPSTTLPAATYSSYDPPPGGEPLPPPPGKSEEPYTQATETMPILATESTCYGLCAYSRPVGLSRVAVYDDGSVAISRDVRVGEQWTLALFSLRLTPAELAEIRAAALTGGLGTGGIHAAGTTAGSADGGGSVFFSRQGTLGTVIEAPLLDEGSVAWGDGDHKQRADLFAVQQKLNALVDRADAKPVQPAAYLIPASNGDCRVVAAADVSPAQAKVLMTLTNARTFSPTADTSIAGRPLLPHEKTCDDVRAWEAMLAAQSRAKLISPLGR